MDHRDSVEPAGVQVPVASQRAASVTIERRGFALRPFEPVLPALCGDVGALFGAGCRLVPVQLWDRLYSHLVRLAVYPAGQTTPSSHLFLKVSKPKRSGGAHVGLRSRVENDFSMTLRVYAQMAGAADFGAVRPIACYPEHLAIVTEEVPGATLLQVLQRESTWPAHRHAHAGLLRAMSTTGRWIRLFQSIPPSHKNTPSASLKAYIDHRLKQIAAVRGRRGNELRARVIEHVDWLEQQVTTPEEPPVTVHADLSPSNVFLSGERVVVLDFAMAKQGHRLQDLARLFTQLDLLTVKPRFRPHVIQSLQEALLHGYDPRLMSTDPDFRLQTLAQQVNHFTSLTVRRSSPFESAYNWFVRRHHAQWLERELKRRPGAR